MKARLVTFISGVIVSGALLSIPASAQVQAPPSGGLFGTARTDTRSDNKFDVTFSLGEGYDTNIPAEFRNRVPQSGPQSGGFSTIMTTTAEYSNVRRRGRITGTGQSSFRYFSRVSEVAPVSHAAALGGRLDLSRTATLSLNQSAAYSPSYLHQLIGSVDTPELGSTIAAPPDYRVDEVGTYSYGTSATLGLGPRRHRFTATADYRYTTHQRDSTARPDLSNYSGRVKYARGIGRNGLVSAGYEYRTGEFSFGPTIEHRLSVGAEFTRALTSSRRLAWRFDVSPSILDIPVRDARTPIAGRVNRLHGQGSLEYPFRRNWRVAASYRRMMDFVPLFSEPLLTDSARAELSGLFTRRLEVSMSAGMLKGESALTQSSGKLGTYTGTTRAQFALSRSFALYGEYLYYFYDLRDQSALAPDLPPTFEQHGVRGGVTVWVPVF
jgi:hypothetical protein